MKADQILDALRRHHSGINGRGAAIVSEVVIGDDYTDWYGDDTSVDPVTRRIDALMFQARERTAIEIKISRSDAARDDWRKIRPWRRVVHRFVYAVPAGLIDNPPVYGCGLWWIHPDGRVEVRRRVKVNTTPEPLPQEVVQALAYRAARAERHSTPPTGTGSVMKHPPPAPYRHLSPATTPRRGSTPEAALRPRLSASSHRNAARPAAAAPLSSRGGTPRSPTPTTTQNATSDTSVTPGLRSPHRVGPSSAAIGVVGLNITTSYRRP